MSTKSNVFAMFACLRPLLACVPVLLASCDDHDHRYLYEPQPSGPQASIQFVHASPDAPPVTVLIDGVVAVPNLDYGRGTGEQPIAATRHSLTIQAQTPGTPTTVIGPITVDLQQGSDYVIAAAGKVASIAAETFTHVLSSVAADATRVQILHAAPAAPTVSVYLTPPGADLASTAPLGTVAFEGALGPIDEPSGTYEIRITPAGAASPVLYDSGTITLAAGADLVITALPNTGPGTAPITLAAVDAAGDNTTFPAVGTPAEVRVIHDSADAPPVSVLLAGSTAAPLVGSLAFPNFTAYLPLTAGAYGIEVTPASNTAQVLIDRNWNLAAGSVYSFYALGTLANIDALVTRDDDRRFATQAKLRLIHGSPSAGPVDVYMTAAGAGIAAAYPTFTALTFTADTGFVSFAAGTYDLTVTAAGSKTAAIGPTAITLADDGIYTAVARDAPGGGTPLGLILLDDFAP